MGSTTDYLLYMSTSTSLDAHHFLGYTNTFFSATRDIRSAHTPLFTAPVAFLSFLRRSGHSLFNFLCFIVVPYMGHFQSFIQSCFQSLISLSATNSRALTLICTYFASHSFNGIYNTRLSSSSGWPLSHMPSQSGFSFYISVPACYEVYDIHSFLYLKHHTVTSA